MSDNFLAVILPVDDIFDIAIPSSKRSSLVIWEPFLSRLRRLACRVHAKANCVESRLHAITARTDRCSPVAIPLPWSQQICQAECKVMKQRHVLARLIQYAMGLPGILAKVSCIWREYPHCEEALVSQVLHCLPRFPVSRTAGDNCHGNRGRLALRKTKLQTAEIRPNTPRPLWMKVSIVCVCKAASRECPQRTTGTSNSES